MQAPTAMAADVREGSFMSEGCAAGLRDMSAMPPIATELVRPDELTRCANNGLMHRAIEIPRDSLNHLTGVPRVDQAQFHCKRRWCGLWHTAIITCSIKAAHRLRITSGVGIGNSASRAARGSAFRKATCGAPPGIVSYPLKVAAPRQTEHRAARLAAAALDSLILLPMPRQSRPAPLNPEPSYPAWKAAAVRALQKLHERAARVTGDGFWTRCYMRNPQWVATIGSRAARCSWRTRAVPSSSRP
jgi:hypothetical protein